MNIENDTRWTSVLNMMQRHVGLHESVAKINDTNLDGMLLSVACERRADSLLNELFEPNEDSLKLQSDDCTPCHIRAYFDLVLVYIQ